MQQSPSSWYLPWGAAPQEKVISLQMPYTGEAAQLAALAAHPLGSTAAAIGTCQATCPTTALQQVYQQQQQQFQAAISPVQPLAQQHSPNSAAAVPPPAHTNYTQHTQLLPTANTPFSIGAYSYPNSCASLSSHAASVAPNTGVEFMNGHRHMQHTQIQNYTVALQHFQNSLQSQHHPQQQAQLIHPGTATAAAMFTPLTLRTFMAAAAAAAAATGGNPLDAGGIMTQQNLTPSSPTLTQQQSAVLMQTGSAAAIANQHISCVQPSISPQHQQQHQHSLHQQQLSGAILNATPLTSLTITRLQHNPATAATSAMNGHNAKKVQHCPTVPLPTITKKLISSLESDQLKLILPEKRKIEDSEQSNELKKAKLETKALKAKRPGFTDERYQETSYYIENGLRKVYPYYFTFTTFTKGRWVGEKILEVFAREFRAHPAEEYERCIQAGTLTVNYEKVPIDYRLKHNDLLANIVHRHEVPVTSQPITVVHMDEDIVVVNKPASIPVHPCGRYRHNTVVFILAKEFNLKNLRTIHRLDRLTSGLLLFGRSPKKARQMEQQIRNRQVHKEYVCRVEGKFPDGVIECKEPIEVVSYKIGVCKVSSKGKDCTTTFQRIAYVGDTSIVLCKPLTGRMHQIRVHLQYLGYPIVNDPLYNHVVFGPLKGRGGDIGGKSDEQLINDLINIHNAENWLGIDGDADISLFNRIKEDDKIEAITNSITAKQATNLPNENDDGSRETTTASITEDVEVGIEPTSSRLTNTNCQAFDVKVEVTVATQTGHEAPDVAFHQEKMTSDKHCYECKVNYRDPKPQDLVMYLHAWKYKGPGWEYETELPNWANPNWLETGTN